MARSEGFEPPTSWFEARRSIHWTTSADTVSYYITKKNNIKRVAYFGGVDSKIMYFLTISDIEYLWSTFLKSDENTWQKRKRPKNRDGYWHIEWEDQWEHRGFGDHRGLKETVRLVKVYTYAISGLWIRNSHSLKSISISEDKIGTEQHVPKYSEIFYMNTHRKAAC